LMMAGSPKPKPVTIRFTARSYVRMLKHLLRDEYEELCFLFAQVVETPNSLIFLVDHVVTFTPDCYLRRDRTSIVLKPEAKNALYSRFVASQYNGLINCHSHPFERGAVRFSPRDDTDDSRELAWQSSELPRGKRSLGQKGEVYVASMVFGQNTLDGRRYHRGLIGKPTLPAIEQVQVPGETIRIITPTGGKGQPPLSVQARRTFDRQILAFGEEGQRALASLRIGVVGCGGIGSIIVEDLARQGARNLILVDPDYLGQSNLNRWQGARPNDVGQLKVKVLSKRLKAMVPEMRITPIASRLTTAKALTALKACDVLIGAVDNHLARFILNRLSVQYLIPYFDAATVIKKGEGDNQMELLARLGVVVPGTTACLSCSQITYYDHKEIAPHLYDPHTRKRLLASGYIQDHPEVASPAVMPLNMLAALMVLIELHNFVTGFHPLARSVVMDYLHPNRRTQRCDFANFPEGPDTDCLTCAGFLGAGDSEPLPGINVAPVKTRQIDKDISLPAATI
jgi:ThiF family